MLEVKGKQSGVIGRHVAFALVALLCIEFPYAEGVKGPLNMAAPPFKNTYLEDYLTFNGIEYRESKIQTAGSPNKDYYFRTDKTAPEIMAAMSDFNNKYMKKMPNGVKNVAPLLRKLGYNIKSKDEMILFETEEEKKDFGKSIFTVGKSNANAYDVILKEGIKVAFARDPAPGLLIFRNEQDKTKGLKAFQSRVAYNVNMPNGVVNVGPLLRELGYNVVDMEDGLLFATVQEKNDFKNSYFTAGESNQVAYDMIKEKGIKVVFAREPAPGMLFFRTPADKAKGTCIVTRTC